MADTVSASADVAASPHQVFEYVRRPANHAEISGDGTVQGSPNGAEVLGPDDKFGMSMKLGFIPYRVTSKVVEFEDDRRIAARYPHDIARFRRQHHAAGTTRQNYVGLDLDFAGTRRGIG